MKYGFVKVAAASPQLKVADVKFNTLKIEEEIARQTKAGTEILVFPELSLCGYTCGDLFLQPLLIEASGGVKKSPILPRGFPCSSSWGFPSKRGKALQLRGGGLRRQSAGNRSENAYPQLFGIL